MSIKWDPPGIEDFDKAIEELDNEMDYIGDKIIIHLDDLDHFSKIFEMYDNIEVKIAKMLLAEDTTCEVGKYKEMTVHAGDVLAPGKFMLFTKEIWKK